MSVKVMGAVWELDLSHSQLLVLLALADHADHDGNNIFPSVGLIAWKTGYSERQVQRIIGECVSEGLLIKVADATSRKPATYRIDVTAGKKKAPLGGCQNVTPERRQNVTPGVTQLRHPRGDTATSPESSTKPSGKPNNPAPQGGAAGSNGRSNGGNPRDPLFDALAVCCWKMPQLFRSEALGEDGGRVGKLKRQLVSALELKSTDQKERLASEIYLCHRRWKNAFPRLAFNRELTAFLSWLYWCRDHPADGGEDHLYFDSEPNDQVEEGNLVEVGPGVYEER
jgi:hypothetical protein